MIEISWQPSLKIVQEFWFIDYFLSEEKQIGECFVTLAENKDLKNSKKMEIERSIVLEIIQKFMGLKLNCLYPFIGGGGPDCDILSLTISNGSTNLKFSWGADSQDWPEVKLLVEETLALLRQNKNEV